MAQVSLYLDKETYGKVETAAYTNGKSISRYVAEIINDHFYLKWPSDFGNLYGSISDNSFFPQGAEKITDDTARESL